MKKKTLKNYPELKGKINLIRETVHSIMFFSRYVFKDDDEEYERIGKFYRGIFRFVEEDCCFTEEEKEILVEIAKNYGAFEW